MEKQGKRRARGVPVMAQWLMTLTRNLRLPVRSLASLSGLRILRCYSCGVGRRLQLQLDP